MLNAWLDPADPGGLNEPSREPWNTPHPVVSLPILEPSPTALLRRRIFGHAGLLIGCTVLAAIILIALFAPWIAPHDPYDQVLDRKLIPPVWSESAKATWNYPLGTDHFGRDYLSRLIWGARISLIIGFSAMLISGDHRHCARGARGVLRRPGRHGRELPHHDPALHAGGPGGDRGGEPRRVVAHGGDLGARPPHLGPFRGRDAKRDHAGSQPRLRCRGAGASAARRRASCSPRSCPTWPTT